MKKTILRSAIGLCGVIIVDRVFPVAPVVQAVARSRSPEPSSGQPEKPTEPRQKATGNLDIFANGPESLVARTVGAAEGTRTADGDKTQNWHGHIDPGDGKWNLGTFSYSNSRDGTSINTPEDADRHYLEVLRKRTETLQALAAKLKRSLSFEELINGIDLANQAPLCITAPDDSTYVHRLLEADRKGLKGQAAILHARVWAFWSPAKDGWDAPGLRAWDDVSKEKSIRKDQERRMLAIADALESYARQTGQQLPVSFDPTTIQKILQAADRASAR